MVETRIAEFPFTSAAYSTDLPRIIRRRIRWRQAIRQLKLTGLAKSFQVIVGRGDGADPAAGAVGGVKVAAGDANQSKPVGPGANPLALAGREAWAVDLDGMQTLVGECLKLGFPEIMGWMCQCGHAAGSSDQGNRPARCRAAVCPRKPGIRPPGNARKPRGYWSPGGFAPGSRPDGAGPGLRGGRHAEPHSDRSRARAFAVAAAMASNR